MPRQPTPEEKIAHDAAVAERFALLPMSINAPTRENTAICLPTGDCRVDIGCMAGLLATVPQWSGFFNLPGCSHVNLARIKLINGFLQSPFEWCVMIDSDIGFTAQDFEWLMQLDTLYGTAPPGEVKPKLDYFAANGVYALKDESGEVVHQGLGFARVHRSVFEVLAKTLCMSSEHRGMRVVDFFPSGSLGMGNWMGEDAVFWLLCAEIGVRPRIEKRVRLQHAGRAVYTVNELENL